MNQAACLPTPAPANCIEVAIVSKKTPYTLDYLGIQGARAGCRIRVPFRRDTVVGIVVGCEKTSSIPPTWRLCEGGKKAAITDGEEQTLLRFLKRRPRATNADISQQSLRWREVLGRLIAGKVIEYRQNIRAPIELIDTAPPLPHLLWELILWSSKYYCCGIAAALRSVLPHAFCRGSGLFHHTTTCWDLSPQARTLAQSPGPYPQIPKRAHRQLALFQLLHTHAPLSEERLSFFAKKHWRTSIRALQQKGMVIPKKVPITADLLPPTRKPAPLLNAEQQAVVDSVVRDFGRFQCHLLEGITGSGKTEVYLALAELALAKGYQTLILVPEIGLTPQTIERCRCRLGEQVYVYHSHILNSQRYRTWCAALDKEAGIVIGTRSASFLPLKKLGLIVIDEEHDRSYKEGGLPFRYHARDILIKRAQLCNIPVVLGSATPSLESIHNLRQGKFVHNVMTTRAGDAKHPILTLMDVRGEKMYSAVCARLIKRMETHLRCNKQVLLFLNRRGYASTYLCHHCGKACGCRHCDTKMVYHRTKKRLICHCCNAMQLLPTHCSYCNSSTFRFLGSGTQQVEESITRIFPNANIIRLDSDVMEAKNIWQEKLDSIRQGKSQIIIGTQMVAKGHDFPNITLVGILDVDYALYAPDFRALEVLGQLIIQVAGRAGRGVHPGEVVLQTYQPKEPRLLSLIHKGYQAFAQDLLRERQVHAFPPHIHFAIVKATSKTQGHEMALLQQIYQIMQKDKKYTRLTIYPPVIANTAKKNDEFHAFLLLGCKHALHLSSTLASLPVWLEKCKKPQVQWFLEMDPLDIG